MTTLATLMLVGFFFSVIVHAFEPRRDVRWDLPSTYISLFWEFCAFALAFAVIF